jgi:hypothetical protein
MSRRLAAPLRPLSLALAALSLALAARPLALAARPLAHAAFCGPRWESPPGDAGALGCGRVKFRGSGPWRPLRPY